MSAKHHDRLIHKLAQDFNDPPATPREEIWSKIERRRREQKRASRWRVVRSPWLWMPAAAAAILLIGIIVYLVLLITIGVVAARRMRGLDDFVLGGRSVGPLAAAISERASGESSWFLLGLPGAAYAAGFTEFWSVIGIAVGIFCSWTFLALPLRKQTEKYGALTIPDYFEARFGDKSRALRVISMAIIIFFYTLYVAAQFVGDTHGCGVQHCGMPV